MILMLALGIGLLLGAAVMLALNLHYLAIGSVSALVNTRIGPTRYVTFTLRDQPDDFHNAIAFNLAACGVLAIVGLTLLCWGIRLVHKCPTKPNGDPWWFI